jgi:hypothetical protein
MKWKQAFEEGAGRLSGGRILKREQDFEKGAGF